MKSYILIHQLFDTIDKDSVQDISVDVVDIYLDLSVATLFFNEYLDMLEKNWRKQSGEIEVDKTFNRLYDPKDNIVLCASCKDNIVFLIEKDIIS